MIGRRSTVARRFLWVLAAQVALHLVGIGWGLPASDGWDNDGVAPRDFLAGMVATVTPGQHFRYPPVHLALLTLLASPVAAVALARSRSLSAADVVAEIIKVPYMTFFALLARAVTIAMAAGTVWALAKTAEELRGEKAGAWTAALAGVCVPLVYYGQTSNLDVPCLFWGCLAVWAAVRAIARQESRLLVRSGVFGALSVGTKDQGYALFALAVPLGVAACCMVDRESWRPGAPARGALVRAVAVGAAILLVVDGPLYNPTGFAHRVAYLAGPASAPFAPFADDASGRLAVLGDVARHLLGSYSLPLVAPVGIGIGLALGCREARPRPAQVAAALVPLLVAVSFTLAFNCVVRRADPRFVLPQAAMASVYGGIGLQALGDAASSVRARIAVRFVVLSALAWGVYRAAGVEVNLLFDPRYEAEDWLRSHLRPGDRIETYGRNAYLPRFPVACAVERVGSEPSAERSPLPGVTEVQGRLGDARARGARFLVVPEAWAGRYLEDTSTPLPAGRATALTQTGERRDLDATRFLQGLRADPHAAGYALVFAAEWHHPGWPRFDFHASTARPVWIYERVGDS